MLTANHPVTSREYKLMLNVDRFRNRQTGCEEFLTMLESLVKKVQGKIAEKQTKEEQRRTSYLDTRDLALYQNGFAVRVREEANGNNKVELNLKYGGADRYLAAAQDVSSPKSDKKKFEEDILPPFVSKFSRSTTIESNTVPTVATVGQLLTLFPGLKPVLGDKNTPIKTVNGFKASEIVRKLCKIDFGEKPLVKASLSFWYFEGHEAEYPIVGEFSFDYDATNGNNSIELYASKVVERANRLFKALQKQEGWLSFATTTKTDFALNLLWSIERGTTKSRLLARFCGSTIPLLPRRQLPQEGEVAGQSADTAFQQLAENGRDIGGAFDIHGGAEAKFPIIGVHLKIANRKVIIEVVNPNQGGGTMFFGHEGG